MLPHASWLALHFTHGVWWSVQLWAGAILLARLVGWLLSYGILPPREPGEADAR